MCHGNSRKSSVHTSLCNKFTAFIFFTFIVIYNDEFNSVVHLSRKLRHLQFVQNLNSRQKIGKIEKKKLIHRRDTVDWR